MLRRPTGAPAAVLDRLLAVHAAGCSEAALGRLAAELQRAGGYDGVQIRLGDDTVGRTAQAGSRSAVRALTGLAGEPDREPSSRRLRSWPVTDPGGSAVGELRCLLGQEAPEPADEQASLNEQVCQQLGVAISHLQLAQLARTSQQWLREEQADRRLAEAAFELLFEGAAAGLATLSLSPDSPGLVVGVNEALCRLLGRSAADLIEHAFVVFIHPDDRPASNAALRRAMSGDQTPMSSQPRLLHADAGPVSVQLTASPLFDEDGTPRYALVQVVELAELASQASSAVRVDPLADLPAGGALDRALLQAHERAARLGSTGAVVVCDLDRLVGPLSDPAGEQYRRVFCNVLRQAMRGQDFIGRLSQNRFLVVAEQVPVEHAGTLARRLVAALAERALSIDIGVAVFSPDDPDPRLGLKRATRAMYGARKDDLPYLLYTLDDAVLYSSAEDAVQVPRQVLYAKPGWRQD